MSGTRLQRNGAIHGDGIYLSTSYETAFRCGATANGPLRAQRPTRGPRRRDSPGSLPLVTAHSHSAFTRSLVHSFTPVRPLQPQLTPTRRARALRPAPHGATPPSPAARSFCQPAAAWPLSRFGVRLRAMLVCEVGLEACVRIAVPPYTLLAMGVDASFFLSYLSFVRGGPGAGQRRGGGRGRAGPVRRATSHSFALQRGSCTQPRVWFWALGAAAGPSGQLLRTPAARPVQRCMGAAASQPTRTPHVRMDSLAAYPNQRPASDATLPPAFVLPQAWGRARLALCAARNVPARTAARRRTRTVRVPVLRRGAHGSQPAAERVHAAHCAVRGVPGAAGGAEAAPLLRAGAGCVDVPLALTWGVDRSRCLQARDCACGPGRDHQITLHADLRCARACFMVDASFYAGPRASVSRTWKRAA
jgi:hypothetical protein